MAQVQIVAEVGNYSTEHGYIKAWEKFQFKGETRNRLWTLWTRNLDGINEGDIITVHGELSTKSATYVPKNATEAKQIVEHSLNNATEAKQIVEHSLNNVAIVVSGSKTTQVRNAADILTQKTEAETIDMPF